MKIVCVGRNYAAHAAEMGEARPKEPLLFLKPDTALLHGGGIVRLPPWSGEVHHEVELVVRLGKGGKDLTAEEAGALVDAYAVGLDLTARDVQTRAKEQGHPWAVAKGWDGSAPVSVPVPVAGAAAIGELEIVLEVDDTVRQHTRTSAMLWPVAELLAFISSRFRLEAGDLIFTGTPEGVGPVASGEHLVATAGRARLEVAIVR